MDNTGIGSRIKKLRSEKKITLEQLAKECRISISSISAYENEKYEPSTNAIVSLSRALGISADYLLTGEDNLVKQDDNKYTQIAMRIAVAFHDLSKNNIDFQKCEKNSLAKDDFDYKELEKLRLVSSILNIDTNWLIYGRKNTQAKNNELTSSQKQLLKLYEDLSESDKQEILEIIKIKIKKGKSSTSKNIKNQDEKIIDDAV